MEDCTGPKAGHTGLHKAPGRSGSPGKAILYPWRQDRPSRGGNEALAREDGDGSRERSAGAGRSNVSRLYILPVVFILAKRDKQKGGGRKKIQDRKRGWSRLPGRTSIYTLARETQAPEGGNSPAGRDLSLAGIQGLQVSREKRRSPPRGGYPGGELIRAKRAPFFPPIQEGAVTRRSPFPPPWRPDRSRRG